jgi:alkaline phosphatase
MVKKNTYFFQTYCVDSMVADSACSASAYLCGVKANDGTIGVTAAVNYADCNAMRNTSNHIYSIIHQAQVHNIQLLILGMTVELIG